MAVVVPFSSACACGIEEEPSLVVFRVKLKIWCVDTANIGVG